MCFLHDMSSKPVAGGGIWKGCRPMVLGAGESSVTAFRSYCFGPRGIWKGCRPMALYNLL